MYAIRSYYASFPNLAGSWTQGVKGWSAGRCISVASAPAFDSRVHVSAPKAVSAPATVATHKHKVTIRCFRKNRFKMIRAEDMEYVIPDSPAGNRGAAPPENFGFDIQPVSYNFV